MSQEIAAKSRWWLWSFIPFLNWISWFHIYVIVHSKKYLKFLVIYFIPALYLVVTAIQHPYGAQTPFRAFVAKMYLIMCVVCVIQAIVERNKLRSITNTISNNDDNIPSNKPSAYSKEKSVLHSKPNPDDGLSTGLGLASLVFFPIGLLIWYQDKEKHPRKAKKALLLSLFSIGILVIWYTFIPHNRHNTGHASSTAQGSLPTAQSDVRDFYYEVVYNDVYDVPIKTQVERHFVVSGEISYSEMEDFLMGAYEDIIASIGYEYRDHPDAVYIYVYAPEKTEMAWIARLEKHAASSSPAISINIDPGSYITIAAEPPDSPDTIEIEDSLESTEEIIETVVIEDVPTVRFEKSGDVITDTETGLQWRVGPNRDLDWYEARDWVNGLGGGWRMPMQNELKVLFDAGITYDDPGPFRNGGWSVWCGDIRDDTYAIDFDLGLGRGIWGPREATGYIRAFAVCSP